MVIWQSDDVCMVGPYLQAAEGVRPDVDIICWPLTSRPWYRARLAARGLSIDGPFTPQPTLAFGDRVLASGRPLFTDRNPLDLLVHRPSFPYGLCVQVRAATEKLPTPRELVELNRALYAKFDLDYVTPGLDDDWATLAQRRYERTWTIIGEWLDQNGDREAAAAARALAAQLAPSS